MPKHTAEIQLDEVCGRHYLVDEGSREAFDVKVAEIMALPGYKTWRRRPCVDSYRDFGDPLSARKTRWRARILVWDAPVSGAGPEAVWPDENMLKGEIQ
jgi:hypothetical protein